MRRVPVPTRFTWRWYDTNRRGPDSTAVFPPLSKFPVSQTKLVLPPLSARSARFAELAEQISKVAIFMIRELSARHSRNIVAFRLCDSIVTQCAKCEKESLNELVSMCNRLMEMRTLSKRIAARLLVRRIPFLLRPDICYRLRWAVGQVRSFSP